jgi:hypothetical protein
MAILARENIQLITFPTYISHQFQPLDLVTFAAFKPEKREIHVTHPEGSQAWQIAKLMEALEHATDSFNNRAAFKRAGLRINPRVFPPVAFVESRQLIEMIDASVLPDGAGLIEVLNQSWLRNVPEQLPFSDSGMESISRINEEHIPSFRKRYGLVISCG